MGWKNEKPFTAWSLPHRNTETGKTVSEKRKNEKGKQERNGSGKKKKRKKSNGGSKANFTGVCRITEI